MNKNVIKLLLNMIKIIGISVVILSLIISSVISHDEHHLEICTEENCTTCHMIILARTIIKVSVLIIMVTLLTFVIYFVLARLHFEEDFYVQNSLIFQKVQFNN